MGNECEHNFEERYYCCLLDGPCVEYGAANMDKVCPWGMDRRDCGHKMTEMVCSECGEKERTI